MNTQSINGFSMDNGMEDEYDDDFQVRQLTNFGVTIEDNLLSYMRSDWERHHSTCVVQVICYIVHALHLLQMISQNVLTSIDD